MAAMVARRVNDAVPLGRSPARSLCLLSWLLAAGCSTPTGRYVWVDVYPEPAADAVYVLQPGDTVSVRVYGQEGMSGKARIRPDGVLSLPFVNDILAAGESTTTLTKKLKLKLKDFVVEPVVTVSLEEMRPLEVSVVGEVVRPGLYRLEPGAGVLTALAAAGSFSNFADRELIFVVRKGGDRIRFTYAALCQPRERAARFQLRPGDAVVVE
jgi:polysaccharide export outer membrane protein